MDQEERDYGESDRAPRLSLGSLAIILVGILAGGILVALVAWIAFLVWFVNGFRNFN
jgi:hypothetical protein